MEKKIKLEEMHIARDTKSLDAAAELLMRKKPHAASFTSFAFCPFKLPSSSAV